MELTLRKATAADAATLVEIYLSAFTIDAISLLCFPRNNDAVFKWWQDMIVSELDDPNAHTIVVTIPSPTKPSGEEIIAFSKWNTPSEAPISTDLPEWPQGCDVKLANHFFGNLFERQNRIMGGVRKHWYLEIIATKPNFQGKGAAGKLMRWGLEKADERNEEVYLEASPDGKPIYEHFSFKEIERMVVDLEGRDPCGDGEKEFVEVMMVRPTQKQT